MKSLARHLQSLYTSHAGRSEESLVRVLRIWRSRHQPKEIHIELSVKKRGSRMLHLYSAIIPVAGWDAGALALLQEIFGAISEQDIVDSLERRGMREFEDSLKRGNHEDGYWWQMEGFMITLLSPDVFRISPLNCSSDFAAPVPGLFYDVSRKKSEGSFALQAERIFKESKKISESRSERRRILATAKGSRKENGFER